MDYILVHYDEIGLKGGNRDYFEKLLVRNIKEKIEPLEILRERGQILVKIENPEKYVDQLRILPGISSILISRKVSREINDIVEASLEIFDFNSKSFKVNTKRHDKHFVMKSPELNRMVGEAIIKKKTIPVKMKNPETTLTIEICNKEAYIGTRRVEGIGGLPIGSAGKMVSLLSGGIDSPVASYLMMKRGAKVVMAHFQNKTNMTASVSRKIDKLAAQLSNIQNRVKLYTVPFDEIQKQLIIAVQPKYRMIIYRRFMGMIAEKIANKEKANSLISGDSLSQVASQTLNNLECIHNATNKMILSPLIGMNKREIIDISKEIGTYDISILPYEDCCSFFIAKNPETKGNMYTVRKIEENIDVENLVELGFKNVKISEFEFGKKIEKKE